MESSSVQSHPISDLVVAFLDGAHALAASGDPSISEALSAELSYELDQVVSNYLDQHQLSPTHFEAIQQDVVNSIAHQITQDSADNPIVVRFDDHGNAGLHDVIALLDHHYTYDQSGFDSSSTELSPPGEVL